MSYYTPPPFVEVELNAAIERRFPEYREIQRFIEFKSSREAIATFHFIKEKRDQNGGLIESSLNLRYAHFIKERRLEGKSYVEVWVCSRGLQY
ncbi:hypothetical protein [Azohydromonas lata]|uniref:Uncharacterized protein n=1 Tax=Azohydromonas lata TaxID=45677 RepID=A0ABU5IFW5_9BURK|nr:hypothetical protein [Azohydromonas lata]MDZ5458012.1 hypothetical protein [Azohydromonas lata]